MLLRNSCGLDCNCTCHESFRPRSPGFLDSVFGSFFLGYEASPWTSPGCGNARCRRVSIKIDYTFPRWFISRTTATTMACSQPRGPDVRPDNARFFVGAQFGYYDEVRRQLENGEASVDVNGHGCTALHVRLNHCLICRYVKPVVRLHLVTINSILRNYWDARAQACSMKMLGKCARPW